MGDETGPKAFEINGCSLEGQVEWYNPFSWTVWHWLGYVVVAVCVGCCAEYRESTRNHIIGVCIGACWGPIAYVIVWAAALAVWAAILFVLRVFCELFPVYLVECLVKCLEGINEYAHSNVVQRQDDGLDAPISGHYTKSPGCLEQLPLGYHHTELRTVRRDERPMCQQGTATLPKPTNATQPRGDVKPQVNGVAGGGRVAITPMVLAESVTVVEAQPIRQVA